VPGMWKERSGGGFDQVAAAGRVSRRNARSPTGDCGLGLVNLLLTFCRNPAGIKSADILAIADGHFRGTPHLPPGLFSVHCF
jgi:hypothetical protein